MRKAYTFAAIAAASGAVACASLIGLEDRPLVRSANDGAPIDAALDDAFDGSETDACAARSPRFCGQLCPPPDFCDDMEEGDSPGANWTSPPGILQPVIAGDASLAFEDGGPVAGRILRAVASGRDSFAMAGHVVAGDGGAAAGVWARLNVQIARAEFEPDSGAAATFFVLGGLTSETQGIGFAAEATGSAGQVLVTVGQRDRRGGRATATSLLSLVKADDGLILRTMWVYELAVGPLDVLERNGLRCELAPDAGGDPGTVRVWARFSGIEPRCTTAQEILERPGWYDVPLFVTGIFVTEGSASIGIDGVAINVLR